MDGPPLVVDDHPASRAALAAGLDAREAGTVAEALAALLDGRPSVVVLDLCLDAPAGELHDALSAARIPVVLVSGLDCDDAARVALARGWICLAKPCTHDTLTAALRAALESRTVIDPDRPTIVPDLPPPPRAVAPERIPSDAPLHADPSVARTDLVTRRALRGLVALLIGALTVWGDLRGHPVSGVTVAVLGALGMGATAIRDAAVKRPGTTAAGGALLLALGIGGDLSGVSELGTLAATGVAAATALVDRAREAA